MNKGLLICLLAHRSQIGAQSQRVVRKLKTVSTFGTQNMNYSPSASTPASDVRLLC